MTGKLFETIPEMKEPFFQEELLKYLDFTESSDIEPNHLHLMLHKKFWTFQ